MISKRTSAAENRITAKKERKESKLFIRWLTSHAMWQNKFCFSISGEKAVAQMSTKCFDRLHGLMGLHLD